jgi:O-antigen/teichoic acid export membrane protein
MNSSLKKRYFYKLMTSIINIPIQVIITSIVPRGLGAESYGNFNYLTDFFTRLTSFFDSGTSTGFYTKLSQRLEEHGLKRYYWGFVAIMSIMMVLLVIFIFLFNIQQLIWIDQKPLFIWLALFWGFLYWSHQIVYKIIDAYGLTVDGEKAIIIKNLIGLCILGALYYLGELNLLVLFIYHFFIFVLMLFIWWKLLKNNNIEIVPSQRLEKGLVNKYSIEFYQFSMPLFFGGLFGFFLGFADRWLLQLFGGSSEQGLYSISYKVGALCFLFTASMAPLFTREISRAYGDNRPEEMRRLFLRFVPMLYSIAVCIGAFFFFQSEKVTILFGGESFKGATMSIALMSLYPLHQTYGQLNSAVYFATGQTKLYRNIGLSIALFGLIVSYLFLAPKGNFGLNLGSTGLALKMVIVQFIGQNIMLWYNTKYLNISFFKMLGHQFLSIIIIGAIAGLATLIADTIFYNIIVSFLTSGLIYIVFLMGILFIFPSLFSTNHNEIIQNIKLFKLKIISS